MGELGKMMVLAGAVILVAGLALMLLGKIPYVGKLPGDIVIKKENFSFYFPLATCVLLSILLSLVSMLWVRK
jgi:uncharacterized membrane protein